MPLPLFLALKYLKPKRSVTSVITCVSVLGVMLGVAAVIIVQSVMTGFGDLWQQKILDFKPHVTLVSCNSGALVRNENEIAGAISKLDGVVAATPEIDTRVLLEANGRVAAPVMIGVDGDNFKKAYNVGRPVDGTFDLDSEFDSMVIGIDLARSLGVWVGDYVTVYSPKSMVMKDEKILSIRWKVIGIFSSGQRDYDSGYCISALDNVREIMDMPNGVFAIHVKTDCPADAVKFGTLCDKIAAEAPGCRRITWREADREIFGALAVEKNMTALLLSLITVVALFCVMNTLLILTVQKTSEIGLMKALGFSKLKIMGAFMVHGLIQCTTGVILGLGLAWLVLSNLQRLVEMLAHFGLEVFPKSVYGLDSIPSRVEAGEVIVVVVLVYIFGFLASLVPAYLAASKNPVEALNK